MTPIKNDLQEWADILFEEIINDPSEYFWPKSKNHKIFEQAHMKFVNRNLNYFDYSNMIVTALHESPEYHPRLVKTLEFCNYVKNITGQSDMPFGRMCVWKVPPGLCILPHVDNFVYHSMITRYIFIISNHPPEEIKIKILDKEPESKSGILFEFFPAYQKHEFNNYSNTDLYFLGFDIYKKDKLDKISKLINANAVINNPVRHACFGGPGTNCKYMSEH